MKEAAVIGSPVSHSRSPAIFSFLASKTGTSLKYSAIEVKERELASFLAKARTELVGFNATIPHKESLSRLLDEVTMEARAVGAVNVVESKDGRLIGHNTDVLGITRTLEEQGCRVQGEDAWVWGAGGAARAVAYALGQLGARCVYLLNRDPARAERIRDGLGALFPGTSFVAVRSLSEHRPEPLSLLVNTTPLGMKGAAAACDFFAAMRELPVKRRALAFDLIYNPEFTPFLAMAEQQGLRTVSGLDMPIYQAIATWEIWFGSFASDAFRAETKAALATKLRERPIFLTGFMGVGKSVVGSTLAARLGWDFIDTDEAVAARAGMPVSRIFEEQGESSFRELERQAVRDASALERAVVSLGGGALLDPDSLANVERVGSLVFLEASPDSLRQRLRATASTRPLLRGLDAAGLDAKIRSMLEARKPIYERATLKISTDGMHPGEVADQISHRLLGVMPRSGSLKGGNP